MPGQENGKVAEPDNGRPVSNGPSGLSIAVYTLSALVAVQVSVTVGGDPTKVTSVAGQPPGPVAENDVTLGPGALVVVGAAVVGALVGLVVGAVVGRVVVGAGVVGVAAVVGVDAELLVEDPLVEAVEAVGESADAAVLTAVLSLPEVFDELHPAANTPPTATTARMRR